MVFLFHFTVVKECNNNYKFRTWRNITACFIHVCSIADALSHFFGGLSIFTRQQKSFSIEGVHLLLMR